MAVDAGTVRVFFDASTKGLQNGLSSAESAIKSAGPKLARAAAVAGAAMVAGLVASVAAAAKFEKQMSAVGSLLGNQEKTLLPKYNKQIRELSVETGQAMDALSAGLFDIVSAGVPAGQAMETLSAAARLAVGGFTSADAATQAIITTMQQFTGEIKDASDAADYLFAVQKGGRLTVEQVSRSLGSFASTGKAAGWAARDLGGAFAAISLTGQGAETSATQLRAILITLAKGSDVLAEKARAVGMEIDFQKIKTEGLIPWLKQFKGMTDVQAKAIFEESRAIQGMNALLANLDQTQARVNFVTNRAGSEAEAYARRQKELSVQFDKGIQLIGEMARRIGSELTPVIKEMFDLFINNKDEVLAWSKKLGETLRLWIGTLDEIKERLNRIGEVYEKLKEAAKTFHLLTSPGAMAERIYGDVRDARNLFAGPGPRYGPEQLPGPRFGPEAPKGLGGGITPAAGSAQGTVAGPGAFPQGAQGTPGGGPLDMMRGKLELDPAKASGAGPFKLAWDEAFGEVFDSGNDIVDNLTRAFQGITDTLSQSFQNVFADIANGGAITSETLKNIGMSFRNLMFKMIADILAKKLAAIVLELAAEKGATLMHMLFASKRAAADGAASQAKFGWVGLLTAGAIAAAFTALVMSFAKFSQGGIVGGIDTGGDSVAAMLRPGEVVLTKAQQMALLTGGAGGGGNTVNIYGTFLEADAAKWDKITRQVILPALDRNGQKTRKTRTMFS